ncbi:sugar porter (SP) family MFS transporter [Brevibacterium sanguinis]|uniref:Sugar porter (SP) family MFS transporter n=2 Tax=Brevibacterium TaxID=1696 RepID=A0A366IIZ4_9MICO|nr:MULTISPECIES: sugar porter family MFS transporter [Brevibacterium]RBP64131.1 sugar porter (SP) family MFS transporter [Brevibacterium sanguinis]RBP71577.1 sugar porter (SP) family MFS transporter [Brevibacterium celere]
MARDDSNSAEAEDPLEEVPKEGLRKVRRWCVIIAVGGFLFGFDTGVISGALLFIKTDFDLTPFEQGSVVSVLLLGALIGALGISRLSDRLGRRKALGLQGVIFLIGTAIAVFAVGYWTLLIARFVLGLAVGAASATVPIYLSEVAPTAIRGRMLTLNQLLITVGILVAYFVNLAFSPIEGWREMIGVGAVPALIIVAGALWFLPESPQWQLANGREDEARKFFVTITDEETADRVIEQRRQGDEEKTNSSAGQDPANDSEKTSWRVLLTERVRPALIVGLTLGAIQQFGGINTIIYYAPSIMQSTGLTASNSIFYSIAIGVINLAMTIVAVRLIDRTGRRKLLLVSLSGMTVTLALLGLSFVAGWSPIVSLVFMVLYIAVYAVGLGPIFWTLVGEIFPAEARANGSSASTGVNWASNFLVSLVFLSVVHAIGQGQTFWIFAIICALGLWFIGRYVPETKDREFEEIDAALLKRFHRDPDTGEKVKSGK